MKTRNKSVFVLTCVFLTSFLANQYLAVGGFDSAATSIERRLSDISAQPLSTLFWRETMNKRDKNQDNHHEPIWKLLKINPDPEVVPVEDECRQKYLIFRPDVQKLLKLAYVSERIRPSALARLRVILNSYGIQGIRSPDVFMPYGPEQLLSQGNVLVLIQADGKEWLIPADSLLTGGLIIGPQQAGKSRFIVHLCLQIQKANPNVVITLIDPKGGFVDYAPLLNADCLDLAIASFDLRPPSGIQYDNFVFEYVPILCDGANLIYGVDIVNEASLIALQERKNFIESTGKQDTELCIKDIWAATSIVGGTSSGRRQGYREAAETALSRIVGNRSLFACRKGISLEKLFTKNTILNGRCLTDDLECRSLLSYFLYYKFQQSRYLPETNKLQHLIIVDDASRFLGTADYTGTSKRISPLGSILALLRATGTGVIAATQLPGFLDPSVIALSRFMAVIGPMSGKENLDVVRNCMSLNDEAISAVTKLSTREGIAFAPNTAFKGIVHGWVPLVETPPIRNEIISTAADYEIEPWHSLLEIPRPKPEPVTIPEDTETENAGEQSPDETLTKASFNNRETRRLIFDCACYPFHSVTARINRLKLSGSGYEKAKIEACEKGYVLPSSAGATL